MTHPARKLRALIAGGEHFIAAEAYSALTGRIVESVGFKAAYLGGHACSAFHYAVPDNGVFSQVEQIEQAGRIAEAMEIPLIADADTLGETMADAFHFARRYARTTRVAGIHIEDEVNPKHSSLSNGLCSTEDMQFRIDAAVRGGKESGLVIIARCDELYPDARRGGGTGSLEEAVKRGKAYAEAGADVLVFPIASMEAHETLVAEMPVPVCSLGYNIPGTLFTLSTGWGWTGAAQQHWARARELMETGSVKMDPTLEGKDKLLEADFYDALVREWAEKTGRPAR